MAMPRILIVEDEPIVALNYAWILEEAGYDILGPVGTIGKGIEIIEREQLDGAVLDIDLSGVPVDPIIEALKQRGLPYLFVSAFPGMVGPYRDALFLDKPCTAAQLIKAVNELPLVRPVYGFDPIFWDTETFEILQRAMDAACAVHRPDLERQQDHGRSAKERAAKAVADMALTGVRDVARLTSFARLAIESSLARERGPSKER